MVIVKNFVLPGSSGRPITIDLFFNNDGQRKPVVIYAHGFNGFKDWGNFDLVAKQFATAGFAFVKFNFSHNGTTPEHPEEFVDLEAFGENNYARELYDLEAVISWISELAGSFAAHIDPAKIFLVGHSRGGGVVILAAAANPSVRSVATWASVAECKTPWGTWGPSRMEEWKQSGVQYYFNARTQQQMPLHYQLYKDYEENLGKRDIIAAIQSLNVPVLICHGTNDEAVEVSKARSLHEANPSSELFLVESDHVFGRKHPWNEETLPAPMQAVVDKTIEFFKSVAG